jgi:hypothetical protein
VSENGLLSHLYIKTIFLPRQALDKHRENSKTDYRFLSDRTVQFDPVAKTVLPWYPSTQQEKLPFIAAVLRMML